MKGNLTALANAPKKVPGRPFKKGGKGGPGNPLSAQVMDFRMAMLNSCTPADLQKIAADVVKKAQKGDPWAIEIFITRIMPYLIGSPQKFGDSREVQGKQTFIYVFPQVEALPTPPPKFVENGATHKNGHEPLEFPQHPG